MVSEALAQFQSTHERLQAQLVQPGWLKESRQQAMERFSALGFPSTRLEQWKYTNLAPLSRIRFASPNGVGLRAATGQVDAFCLPDHAVLTFVDGRFCQELSRLAGLPAAVEVKPLSAALSSRDEGLLSRYLSSGSGRLEGALEALSLALFEDGALVRWSEGAQVERPVQLLYIDSGADSRTAVQLQNVVLVEPGARGQLVESYVSLAEQQQLTNVATQIVCQPDARLEHYRLLDPSRAATLLSTLELELHERSSCSSRSVCLGGELVRNEIRARLQGEQASVTLDGLFMVDQKRHVDTHTLIEHAKPRCRSEQLFKGILGDESEGVFSGTIRVHEDAQQTDALQSSKNLLLSDEATINARPQLEILADDVKCTHGATIGHLDDEALFYLRARGLDQDLARALLVQAFAGEVIGRIPRGTLHDRLQAAVLGRLPVSAANGPLS